MRQHIVTTLSRVYPLMPTVTSYSGAGSAAKSWPAIGAKRPVLDRITSLLLWCFVFSVPFERMWMLSGIGTVSRLLGLVLVPVALTALLMRGWIWRLLFAHWCMIAFVGWSALSFFWTFSPQLTRESIVTEAQLLGAVLLIWQFCDTTSDHLINAYIGGTVIACIGTLANFVSGESVSWERYAAEGFDPNSLSLLLALSIPLSYYLFLRSRKFSAVIWLAHIGLVTVTCLMTASRMGAIVTVVAVLVVPLSVFQLKGGRLAAVVLAIGVAAYACVTFVPSSSWERVLGTISEFQGGTLNDRTEIWTRGLELVRQEPLVGVGAGAFPEAVNRVPGNPLASLSYVAHNTFLSVLSEVGLIGAFCFLLVLTSLIILILEMMPDARRTWLITFSVWAIGAFTLTWEQGKPTWVMFALLIEHWRRTATPSIAEPVRSNLSFSPFLRFRQPAVRQAEACNRLPTPQ